MFYVCGVLFLPVLLNSLLAHCTLGSCSPLSAPASNVFYAFVSCVPDEVFSGPLSPRASTFSMGGTSPFPPPPFSFFCFPSLLESHKEAFFYEDVGFDRSCQRLLVESTSLRTGPTDFSLRFSSTLLNQPPSVF